jgi:hypothetical protein
VHRDLFASGKHICIDFAKPDNQIPTLPSSQQYDWVKPDNEIPTLPSCQKYDWVKPHNEIPNLPSSQKYDWVKPDGISLSGSTQSYF